MQFLAVNWED